MSSGPLPWRRVLVVFADAGRPRWLRLLKPGFRHVFLIFEAEAEFVVFEPMSHCTRLDRQPLRPGLDLFQAYRALGHAVLEVEPIEPVRRLQPWRPYSCVEATKRLLGLRAGWVLTPWQLYKFLCIGKNT